MEDWLASQHVISLVYLLQAGESSDAETFVLKLAQRVPKHGAELMSIAQQLEQKGIERGCTEGRSEGERETTLKIARAMLRNGLSVMKMTGLNEDNLQRLRH